MAQAQGQALKEKAEKCMKGGMFSFMTGVKYDEAGDLYVQAANQFKLAKDWQEAANCFSQAAYCSQKQGSSEEANFYTEAGNVLMKVSTTDATEEYQKAIAIYDAGGRFSQSGKLAMKIAEAYETEGISGAKEFFKIAAEKFDLDDYGKSNYGKCILKVAEYDAKEGNYAEAIKVFESEGEKALQNSLLQFGAKDHFLRAGILHMVMGDSVTVNISIEKYCSLDPRFASSREGELLKNLAGAFEERDVELFVDKLAEYDEVTKLDSWKTELLVKVKEQIAPSAALLGEGLDLT